MAIHNYDGKKFDSFEELREHWRSEMTVWDKIVSATWYRAHRRTRDAWFAVKYAWQRVFRGWDDRASWNIDHYLAKNLGEQLVAMSEFAHGYPGEHYPFDKWTADLKTHGDALVAYSRDSWESHSDEAWNAICEPAKDALRWVADNLPTLWD